MNNAAHCPHSAQDWEIHTKATFCTECSCYVDENSRVIERLKGYSSDTPETVSPVSLINKILDKRSREELIELVLGYRRRWLEKLGTYDRHIDGESTASIPDYMKMGDLD